MTKHHYAVIMAGGAGTRLWPVSRQKNPKQFQKLTGKRSLFQQTFSRIKRVVPASNIFVSIGKKHLKAASQQLPTIPQKNYIIEPVGRNTAPAVGLATLYIHRRDPRAIVATLASDHEIQKEDNFVKDLKLAFAAVARHPFFLLTIGLKPTYPATGYGYIKIGKKFDRIGARTIYRVNRFVEKPDEQTAQRYLDSNDYLWNASYFIFQAAHMLNMYEKHSSKIWGLLKKIGDKIDDQGQVDRLFEKMPNEPIDTEIMEKGDKMAVIPADLGWSDVGSWKSVYEILCQKLNMNEIVRGEHIGYKDKNIFVLGHKRMIATVGLENIAVIDTSDVTLVINKNRAQDIRKIVEKLKKRGKKGFL
jgi:mannose-1-phosphate guanylyltransferase